MSLVSRIQLDAEQAPTIDAAGRYLQEALRLGKIGDKVGADRAFQRAVTTQPHAAETDANLALMALLGRKPTEALRYARAAVATNPKCVAAWINLSVAALQSGARNEILPAAQRAVELAPQHGIALFNLGRLLLSKNDPAAADVLQKAALANPNDWRIVFSQARAARAAQQTDTVRRYALDALAAAPATLPKKLKLRPQRASLDVTAAGQALCDASDTLNAAGIPFFLIAGTLLALVRDGDLLPHDKDIDLGLPDGSDPDRVAAVFETHPGFTVPPRRTAPDSLWAYGVIHKASGVTIDLFFCKKEPTGIRFGLGIAPETIFSVTRPFELATLQWRERNWLIPGPPEQYLEDIYGSAWRQPDRHFDTVLSNPSRSKETLPIAINLGLLRLGDCLQNKDWARAYALCQQLLARENLSAVADLQRELELRCPDLLR